jgi:hypothetical protein
MSNRLKTVATNIETHNEIIVDSEGNVKEITQREVSSKKIPAEPNFIKLYLQDICKLNDLPKTSSKLLNELLKYSNYENLILLPAGIKKEIAKKLDTTVATLDNALSKLTKKEVLKREGTGMYRLNPFLFGKGSWANVSEIRVNWSYGKEGRRLTNVEIRKEIETEVEEFLNESEKE